MADSIIKIEGVDFWYDKGTPAEVHALKNVSLEVRRGEYVSFFGPSGCGKSTLLYMIAGVEEPKEGKMIVNGTNLADFSQKELAIYRQVGIGIIFQNFNLISSIRVAENVSLPMAFLGISPKKRAERTMQILDRLGIAHIALRYPKELSGGQQQRVGIARALANDPPIILADEPIGNLDSENAENVLHILKELNEKEGKTVIMVTHEPWSMRDSTRVFYMKDGVIIKVEDKKPAVNLHRANSSYYAEGAIPSVAQIETHAKMLAATILKGYAQAEIERLEKFIAQRFKGELTHDEFRELLDKPFKEGGIGLWKQRAAKIAEHIDGVVEKRHELDDLYVKLRKDPDVSIAAVAERMRSWATAGLFGKLSALQAERLNELIAERLRNIITIDNFRRVLDLPIRKGGVGLRVGTSMKIAERLDSVIMSNEPAAVPVAEPLTR